MARLPRKLQKIFGINAGANQIGRFGSLTAGAPTAYSGALADPEDLQSLSQYLGGWFSGIVGNSNPAIQDMNALFFLLTYQLTYLFQEGVPEWNAQTEYYQNSYAKGGNGNLYRSLQNSNTNHIVTDLSWWVQVGSGGGLENTPLIDLSTLYGGRYYQADTNASSYFVNITNGFVGGNFVIVDVAGNAATNNITIIPAVGQKLNGVTNGSLVINTARSGYWMSWDAVNSSWQATPIGMGGAGSGGLAPVVATAAVNPAVKNKMYLANTSGGAFTVTLPGGTDEAVVGVLDALGTFGTNKLSVAPATGQYIDTGAINEVLELDFDRANAVFYRAASTNVWRIQYQLAGIGGSGGGGLTPVPISANGTCATNTLEDVDCTAGSITRTLPLLPTSGQAPITIRILDSERQCTTTKKIICAPASGQSIDGLGVNVTLDINYAGGWVEFNAAPGATSWKVTTQATAGYTPNAGRWTPILTSTTNIASSVTASCLYSQAGNIVTCSGYFSVTPTAGAATLTSLEISLPIASNLTSGNDLAGSGSFAVASGTQQAAVVIYGNPTTDRAIVSFSAPNTANNSLHFNFQYEVK